MLILVWHRIEKENIILWMDPWNSGANLNGIYPN